MEHPTAKLEDALARTEADTEAALKISSALTSQLKRAKKAAALGSLRDLERALAAADELAGARVPQLLGSGGWFRGGFGLTTWFGCRVASKSVGTNLTG